MFIICNDQLFAAKLVMIAKCDYSDQVHYFVVKIKEQQASFVNNANKLMIKNSSQESAPRFYVLQRVLINDQFFKLKMSMVTVTDVSPINKFFNHIVDGLSSELQLYNISLLHSVN